MVSILWFNIKYILFFTTLGIYLALIVAAAVGALFVLGTRADAFDVADRKPKMFWCGLLAGSAVVFALNLVIPVPFLPWIAMVITGLYWFDVRPQIKNILEGNFGW